MAGSTPTAPQPRLPESSDSLVRIIALSDGVFAIAITLLVLDVVPHIAGTVQGDQFVRALLDMAPLLVAYVLSFLVIGRFWDTHRRLFRSIHLVDPRLVWTNLAVLLWVTLIPATAALLGAHWHEPAALVLYALNLLLATVSLWMLWRYVTSAGYTQREGLPARSGHYINRYAGASIAGYALAIPTALVSPPAALALIFLTTAVARSVANRILSPGTPRESGAAAGHPDETALQMDER